MVSEAAASATVAALSKTWTVWEYRAPSTAVGNAHTSFGAAMLADNLKGVLPIYADLVRQPRLPDDDEIDKAQDGLFSGTSPRSRTIWLRK